MRDYIYNMSIPLLGALTILGFLMVKIWVNLTPIPPIEIKKFEKPKITERQEIQIKPILLPPPPALETIPAEPTQITKSGADLATNKSTLPKAATKPAPTPKPVPSPIQDQVSLKVSSQNQKMGRGLLKMLEHGQGPAIQMNWPEENTEREALYSYLTNCAGMITAYLHQDRFYRQDQSGPWHPDMDYISGFLRHSAGERTNEEDLKLQKIRSRHNLPSQAIAVRLFPRQIDAQLLGGLRQVIGTNYLEMETISARYERHGTHVRITDIQLNGVKLQETFLIIPKTRCTRT